jgi:DEAD/DEAH box helicase domain-containing protein
MAGERNIVVFDVETQKSFDEVGGRAHIQQLGLSVAVAFSTATGEYSHYTEAQVNDLVAQLEQADLVVGFNVLSFDYEVLRAYTQVPLAQHPTVDILDHLQRRLGFRVSLDTVAEATLGQRKTAEGLQAIQWYREGKFQELFTYCQQDVAITYRLFDFGRTNKYVQYRNRNFRLQKVLVNW